MELKLTKICPVCGRDLPFAAFRHERADGTHKLSMCIDCKKERLRKQAAARCAKKNPDWKPRVSPWTDERLQVLCALYPDTRTAIVAEKIGVPLSQTAHKAQEIGLRKTPAYLSEIRKHGAAISNAKKAKAKRKY